MHDIQPHRYDVTAAAERLDLVDALNLAEQWAASGGRTIVYRRRRFGRVAVIRLDAGARRAPAPHPTPWTVSYDGDDDRAWLVDAAGRDVQMSADEVLQHIADAVNRGRSG